MKVAKLIFSVVLSTFLLTSCSFYTAISYRVDKKQEYVKEDGYMLNCYKDHFSYGDVLILGTYTPDSWGDGFYYGYLDGKPSNQKVKILSTKLSFIDTGDTLSITEIRDERIYIYQSSDLKTMINNNKHMELAIFFQQNDDTTTIEKTFLLTRHKHTYPTGTFPHTF